MEGGKIYDAGSYGELDLQDLIGINQLHLPIGCIASFTSDGFSVKMGRTQSSDQRTPTPNDSMKLEEEQNCREVSSKIVSKIENPLQELQRQHVKCSDKTVKLLITVVSYMAEEMALGQIAKRKFISLQGNSKWDLVSRIMAGKGHHVSSQWCKNKFNDLNKSYIKLNAMLGRGTSCQVVENPALLDLVEYLSEEEKLEVRRILSSKQLFYEEMCSYYNRNRISLPHDPSVQCLVRLELRNPLDFDGLLIPNSDVAVIGGQGTKHNQKSHGDDRKNKLLHYPCLEKCGELRVARVEEQRLRIQAKMVELRRKRLRYEKFCQRKERKLSKMKQENENIRVENEHMAMELRQRGWSTWL